MTQQPMFMPEPHFQPEPQVEQRAQFQPQAQFEPEPQAAQFDVPVAPPVVTPSAQPPSTTSPAVNQFGLPVTSGGQGWTPGQADAPLTSNFSHSGTGYSSRLEEVNANGRVSMEHNSYGHYSLGLSGAAALVTVLLFVPGGVPYALVPILAIPGVYYGVRGWNAAVRNFATNGKTALTGAILGVLTLLAIPVYFLYVAAQVAAIIEEGV